MSSLALSLPSSQAVATFPLSDPCAPSDEPQDADEGRQGWLLATLKPKHKQICSMLAQGIPRGTIAAVIGCTPEYITMLSRQPLIQGYIKDMCQTAGLQLEAMFTESVQAIGDVLQNGSTKDKMQAARLQMEATKRIGAGSGLPREVVDTTERLAKLAERLLYLQGNNLKIINTRRDEDGKFTEAEEGFPDLEGI